MGEGVGEIIPRGIGNCGSPLLGFNVDDVAILIAVDFFCVDSLVKLRSKSSTFDLTLCGHSVLSSFFVY